MAELSVDIDEAKTHLSRLVERVEAGEEIVIARAGRPVAKLVLYARVPGPRRLGIWRGKVAFAPDFDQTTAKWSRSLNVDPAV